MFGKESGLLEFRATGGQVILCLLFTLGKIIFSFPLDLSYLLMETGRGLYQRE